MPIVRKTLKEIVVSQKEWDRALKVRDEDIDLSDIPEFTEEDFRKARRVTPEERRQRTPGVREEPDDFDQS